MTHTLLGAAVALPIAVSRDPAIAAGCIWFGMVGGDLPDWIDLRSDFRTSLRLRHRGASHSVLALMLSAGIAAAILVILQRADFRIGNVAFIPSNDSIAAWVTCLALGFISHLLSDACTISGIQPLLPFAKLKMWLLPKMLRSRSDGYMDTIVRWISVIALSFGVVVFASRWIAL